MPNNDEKDEMEVDDDQIEEQEDDGGEEEEVKQEGEEGTTNKEIYLPGKPLKEGEELVFDETAYVMMHQLQTGAPCLSFDIIPDNLGGCRETYPMCAYIVAGSQAPQNRNNNIIVMKLCNLHKFDKKNEEEDEDEDSDNDDEKDPKLLAALIGHQGCVNRIRCTKFNEKIVAASWSELGKVSLWDLSQQLEMVENETLLSRYNNNNKNVKPLYTFNGHVTEGYALDWSPTMPGVLASGDCKKNIHIWKPREASWHVDQRPLIGHKDSVEDLQWSPNENNVLASCSVDKSIRIWDTRAQPNKACMLTVEDSHKSDVNVISWNKNEPFIVSGGDDGFLHIWDLRRFQEKTPVAIFKHHIAPVTTVEWHPTDSAVFASGGEDNQIALWDLSVEKDEENDTEEIEGIPPQLLFIHQGQTNIKELHWHPQIPGTIISTAESGFNIFKTISV